MAKKPKKGSFVVIAKCVVRKEIVCSNCTEDEARDNPWEHFVSEREIESLIDWDVEEVEPND